jgi:hypothetical protein
MSPHFSFEIDLLSVPQLHRHIWDYQVVFVFFVTGPDKNIMGPKWGPPLRCILVLLPSVSWGMYWTSFHFQPAVIVAHFL